MSHWVLGIFILSGLKQFTNGLENVPNQVDQKRCVMNDWLIMLVIEINDGLYSVTVKQDVMYSITNKRSCLF